MGQEEQTGVPAAVQGRPGSALVVALTGEQRPESQPELFHLCALAQAVPFTLRRFLLLLAFEFLLHHPSQPDPRSPCHLAWPLSNTWHRVLLASY